jgi:hypothetical protein
MIENQILNDKNQKLLMSNGTTSGHFVNKSDTEEIINITDTENESNSSHQKSKSTNQVSSNNNNNKKSDILAAAAVATSSNQSELPNSVSPTLQELVNKFINLHHKNSSHLQNVWTDELKDALFKIYKDSSISITVNDRSQLFNYISAKTNKTKDSLLRHCRKLLSKEQNNSTQPQQSQQQHQNKPTTVECSPANLTTSLLNNSFNKSPVTPGQQQINPTSFNDLDEKIKSNLNLVEREYQLFKNRSGSEIIKEKFFETKKIQMLIYSIDQECRSNISRNTNKMLTKKLIDIKNYVIDFMARSFEMQRPIFIRILNQILLQQREQLITEKIALLKKAIDDEMPKQLAKFKKTYDDFIRLKAQIEASGEQNAEKKKLNPPRKKFDWNQEIRDLYLSIVNMKMELYPRSLKPTNAHTSNVMSNIEDEQNKRLEYLRTFLVNSIINLWPDNWMQMNVLINASSKSSSNNTAATTTINNNSNNLPINKPSNNINNNNNNNNNNNSTQLAIKQNENITSTTGFSHNTEAIAKLQTNQTNSNNIINISSKSGKQIKLEHQPLEQPCMPPLSTSTSSTNITSTNSQQVNNSNNKQVQDLKRQINNQTTSSKLNVQIKQETTNTVAPNLTSVKAQQSPQTNIKQHNNNNNSNSIQSKINTPQNNTTNNNSPRPSNTSIGNNMLVKQSPTPTSSQQQNIYNSIKNTQTPTTPTTNSNFRDNLISPRTSQCNKSPTSNVARNQQQQQQQQQFQQQQQQQQQQIILQQLQKQQLFAQQFLANPDFNLPSFLNAVTSSPNVSNTNNKTNFPTNSS